MKTLKTLFEQVFFPQENGTISLSFESNPDAQQDITKIMDQVKTTLNSIGIDEILFDANRAIITIVTTADKKDEVLRVAQDFNAVVVHCNL